MPSLCPHFLRNVAVYSLLFSNLGYSAPQDFALLEEIDFRHPYCESASELDISRENFITIANELPGKDEYNELVRTFHRSDWEKLDKGIEAFQRVFETSPLREAVTFLSVESLFDRMERTDSEEPKLAEKQFRETLLLYPHSTLIPVLSATVASFWLKRGLYQKSLAMYESARQEYPFHSLSCLFQFGVGENGFLLHDWEPARRAFNQVLQKCDTPRLIVGARLRLIQMRLKSEPKVASKELEKLYESEGNILTRFFPAALHNLGEIKYGNAAYDSAKFFFNEYLKSRKIDVGCQPYALKRLADIAFHKKQPLEQVVGLYLAAHEQLPGTDVGRFCYTHALLLELKKIVPSEMERRIKLIDEEIEHMKDSELQSIAYLDKGLSMLDVGEKSALGYLLRLNERKTFNLRKGALATFVRDKYLAILQTQANGALDKVERIGSQSSTKDKPVFEPVEEAYTVWFKGSNFDGKFQTLYSQLIFRRFDEATENGKLKEAIEKLERWQKSPLWSTTSPDKNSRHHVGSALVRMLDDADPAEAFGMASILSEKAAALQPFISKEYSLLNLAGYHILRDEKKTAEFIDSEKGKRKLASLNGGMPSDVQAVLWRRKGLALAFLKRYQEAEVALQNVKDSSLYSEATKDRVINFTAMRKFPKAFRLGAQLIPKLPKDEKVSLLGQLRDIVNEGKLWRDGMELLVVAQQVGIKGKELSPFQYTAGKCQAELGECDQAIENLEAALALEPQAKEMPEARFRLGKCLLKKRKREQARKIWEDVVTLKDSFWSPLAKNELHLLEKP